MLKPLYLISIAHLLLGASCRVALAKASVADINSSTKDTSLKKLTDQSRRLVSAFILVSILSLSTSMVLTNIAAARTINPLPIPQNKMPPLPKGAIFRAIASGGMIGRTSETTLMSDGRVIQVVINIAGTASKPRTHQISQQQVQQFHQLLQSLSQFRGLSYPAPGGAADYVTVSLTSQVGTTCYADIILSSLPDPLQQVIRAWNQITAK